MEIFLHISIKLSIGFIALFVSAKIIGGREIKQLTAYDFISAIVLSELVGNGLYSDEVQIIHILFTITLWTAFIVLLDKIALKSRSSRKLLDGTPQYVIQDGVVNKQVLSRCKMDLDEMLSLLRQKDIFAVSQVKFAIIESNGNVSVFKADMNASELSFPVIMDGEVQLDSLHQHGKEKMWLDRELKKQGFNGVENVFYAELLQNGDLFVADSRMPNSAKG